MREYLNALNVEAPEQGRTPPKVISRLDPASAWTAKANKRVQFGYGLNYLIDTEHAIIVDVEPTLRHGFRPDDSDMLPEAILGAKLEDSKKPAKLLA